MRGAGGEKFTFINRKAICKFIIKFVGNHCQLLNVSMPTPFLVVFNHLFSFSVMAHLNNNFNISKPGKYI